MLNKVTLIGRLGKDPEIKELPSGDSVANFSIATTEKWKDKQSGEAKEAVEWHRINMFGKLAEIAGKYLKSGSLVYLEGSIKTRKWTDKDGIEKYSTDIKADTMKMLGSKGDSAKSDHAPSGNQATQGSYDDSDIPF